MGASLEVRDGTGHRCYLCGKKINKDQIQISFRGWNASAVIHSSPIDCKFRKRHRNGK